MIYSLNDNKVMNTNVKYEILEEVDALEPVICRG